MPIELPAKFYVRKQRDQGFCDDNKFQYLCTETCSDFRFKYRR